MQSVASRYIDGATRPNRYVSYYYILGLVAEDGFKHVTFAYYGNILSTILTLGLRDSRDMYNDLITCS
jgi:hypothetical protein